MSWKLTGTYVENCSCAAICPCTWSGLTLRATGDRCRAVMTYHLKEGEIESVDVSGLIVGVVIDTPPLMSDGNWTAGLLIDAAASEEQAEKLESVFSGKLGGPPAWLVPLVSEWKGVARIPATHDADGREHRVRFGDMVDITVRVEGGRGILRDPAGLVRLVFEGGHHPPSSSNTLTVAPTVRSRVSAFGIEFGGSVISGFTTGFAWSV
jgi:hypothetical protein